MRDARKFEMPHVGFGEEPVEQRPGLIQMPDENTDNEPDHGDVVAAAQQHWKHHIERHARPDEVIAHPLQRLQRAHARVRPNTGSPVPVPRSRVADVHVRRACDLQLGAIAVKVGVLRRLEVPGRAPQGSGPARSRRGSRSG